MQWLAKVVRAGRQGYTTSSSWAGGCLWLGCERTFGLGRHATLDPQHQSVQSSVIPVEKGESKDQTRATTRQGDGMTLEVEAGM